MKPVVYLNGEYVSAKSARISVYDGGWLHGAGLFETMRAENGCVFRLGRHMDRLRASSEQLLSPLDRSLLPSAEAFSELMSRNESVEARVRLTVSAGDMNEAGAAEQPNLTVCATAAPLSAYPKELYEQGISVMVSRGRQSATDPLAGHKTTNYLSRLIAMNEAIRHGCGEALWFTPENLLAEGSISNVFVVKGDKVSTPPLDTPVLPGIAREVVLELCGTQEFEHAERAINVNDLLDADEVFLTNSIMQVMPVRSVEQKEIGDGKPGPITKGLMVAYRLLVDRECHCDES